MCHVLPGQQPFVAKYDETARNGVYSSREFVGLVTSQFSGFYLLDFVSVTQIWYMFASSH